MIKRKNAKEHGKLKFSAYFQEFNKGDKVAIIREQSLNPAFPRRIQGMTGTIEGSRGNSYLVKIMDGKAKKVHIIKPVHLKKLQ